MRQLSEPTIDQPRPPQGLEPWEFSQWQNIGQALTETAARMPDSIAVASPRRGQPEQLPPGQRRRFDTITFGQLEQRSNQIARGLQASGVRPGMRLALMVPPGIDFVAHVFALYKSGAVSILIDPGMGRNNMIGCLADALPEGIVGIPKAQLARWIFRSRFPNCRHNVVVGGWFPGCQRSSQFCRTQSPEPLEPTTQREDPASIIFTTGSTGPPKGVLYRHRQFIEQSQQIRDYFDIRPGTVDVSGFPLFALFNTAMGATTVFPEMDATRPAEIHPPNLIDAVTQFQASQSFGSPALWNTVSRYCLQHQVRLPSMVRVLTAGAPVAPEVLEQVRQVISADGDVYTPYGATESLPVACNSATEVLGETGKRTRQGAGTCVGRRFPRIQWRLIEISDQPLTTIEQTREVPPGEIGELMVSGPVVTDQYVTRTEANAEHKVADGDRFWHRMGDVGYFDDQDRFWFCGRKGHRVQTAAGTLFTVPCEAIINTHPRIYRSALVGVGTAGEETPVIVLEPHADQWPETPADRDRLVAEVRQIAAQHWQTDRIEHFLVRRSLPVDIRHNSKIFREQLRPWAKQQLASGVESATGSD